MLLLSCWSVNIRRSVQGDFEGIMKVAKTLHPDWFDSVAINESIPRDTRICKGCIAEERGRIVGFIFYSFKGDKARIK